MYYLMTKPKFFLSSVSSGWLFWSVSHPSKYENCESNVFTNMKFVGEILIVGQMLYLEQMCTKLLNFVWIL